MIKYCRMLNIFKDLSCKIGDPHLFSYSFVKGADVFSVISIWIRSFSLYYIINFLVECLIDVLLIFNFSSCNLHDHSKSVLSKSLSFAIPPKSFEYSDFLLFALKYYLEKSPAWIIAILLKKGFKIPYILDLGQFSRFLKKKKNFSQRRLKHFVICIKINTKIFKRQM